MSPEDEVFGGFSKKSLDRIRSSMRSEEVRVVDKVIFVRKLGSEYPHMADGEVEALLDRSCHEGIDIDAVVVLTDDKEYNLVLPVASRCSSTCVSSTGSAGYSSSSRSSTTWKAIPGERPCARYATPSTSS